MNFSPSVSVPDQLIATTPNMFIVDPYGKSPKYIDSQGNIQNGNGDGPLTIKEAIRISKLINKYIPAFTRVDNRIIDGFEIESARIEKDNVKIILDPGVGVISRTVFRVPMRTEIVLRDFTPKVPATLQKGSILLFFEYSDLMEDAPNRPLPQSDSTFAEEPHYPTTKLPKDQTLFNPIKIVGYIYDPETKSLVDQDGWDETTDRILIASGIHFRRLPNNKFEIYYDDDERNSIIVGSQTFVPQNTGYAGSLVIDGGLISDGPYGPIDKLPYVVDIYYDKIVTNPAADIILRSTPSSFNEFYLFVNGILLHPETDYEIASENSKLTFVGRQIKRNDYIYAFENISGLSSGCLKSLYRARIEESGKIINNENISPDLQFFIFYDGQIIDPVYYEVQNESIRFVNTLEAGKYIDILEVIPSPSSRLEVLYNGIPRAVSPHDAFVHELDPYDSHLVFYGGKLVVENSDYTLRKNIISFSNEIDPSSNEKLIVIRI